MKMLLCHISCSFTPCDSDVLDAGGVPTIRLRVGEQVGECLFSADVK